MYYLSNDDLALARRLHERAIGLANGIDLGDIPALVEDANAAKDEDDDMRARTDVAWAIINVLKIRAVGKPEGNRWVKLFEAVTLLAQD